MRIRQPLKLRHRGRLPTGHGGHLEDDGPQFLLRNPPFATEDREQSQAAKEGNAKAHGFSDKRCLYFFILLQFGCLRKFRMSPEDLTARLKAEAQRLGFDLAGATAALAPPRLAALHQWLADGFAGQMEYIPRRATAYEHPSHVLDGARSLLMLAMAYHTQQPAEPAPGQGMIARYAWGTDYHDVIRERLHALADFHRELTPEAAVRGVVDTAPLLEREFAELAGLGWVGKSTLLLNRRLGSWFLLAALLTSETLVYDEPTKTGHCGTCRACIDACPTGAIVEPYRLDARKCISYLTIELHEPIPAEQRRRSASGSSAATSARTFVRSIGDQRQRPSRPSSRGPIRIRSVWPNCFIWTKPLFVSDSAAARFYGPGGEVCFARPLMPWAIGRR